MNNTKIVDAYTVIKIAGDALSESSTLTIDNELMLEYHVLYFDAMRSYIRSYNSQFVG